MPSRLALASFIALLISACGGGASSNTNEPPPIVPPTPTATFTTEDTFSALSFVAPVAMVQVPNDPSRWFVVEKGGIIKVFDNDPQTTTSDNFVNITARVNSASSEAGFLGLAFHPDFANNGEAFLSYTRTASPLESVISRFRSFDGGATLDPTSEEILITVPQDFVNHNGGNLAFGSDGFLYAGFGDGGSANDPFNRAQNNSNLLGTVIRIDVDNGAPYAIPPSNQFAGNGLCSQGFGAAGCAEIFAHGLRNPWRFSFDSANGDLWLADVGQDMFEEVNLIQSGGNYGWAEYEGDNCNLSSGMCQTTGFEVPIHTYDHSVGASVTGGYVYRGSNLGTLIGRYIFGDAVSGRVWALPANAAPGAQAEELIETSFVIASFGQDANGELYVVDFSGGKLHQLIEGSQ